MESGDCRQQEIPSVPCPVLLVCWGLFDFRSQFLEAVESVAFSWLAQHPMYSLHQLFLLRLHQYHFLPPVEYVAILSPVLSSVREVQNLYLPQWNLPHYFDFCYEFVGPL
jgi:hypothetical protein